MATIKFTKLDGHAISTEMNRQLIYNYKRIMDVNCTTWTPEISYCY